jgi:general secretion pathway protein A
MVLPFYQLCEQPFGVTPDSRYFFLSNTHGEALASLLYGVDAGCGFLALIAAPGLGKTTLLYNALRFLRQSAVTVFLFETVCTPLDLLRSLLTALGVKDAHGNLTRMQARLQEVLIEQARLGRRVVVVMDEAQNLDHALLELLRMLSNFETQQQKLLHIILAGQPQLAETIASPGLEQLRQRISIFSHLKPFSREETQLYIEHRLRVAGYVLKTPLFTRDALTLIAESSGGVPRTINNLCFHALSLGCARKQHSIGAEILREAIADLDVGRWKEKSLSRAPVRQQPLPAAPAFRSPAGAPSRFPSRSPGRSLAFAFAVVILIAGLLFAGPRWPVHWPVARAHPAPLIPVAPRGSAIAGETTPSAETTR